mmetsp:Transcript_16569/g.37235  ORF Transcript_16569/g.37235 Transcript_16569/m.37235 type:complete len:747 (+) Transcript_16569:133-2373(+)
MKSFSFAISIFYWQHVQILGEIVREGGILDKDVVPIIGRGYSTISGDFFSTCVSGIESNDPTYDYDFKFIEERSEYMYRRLFTSTELGSDVIRNTLDDSKRRASVVNEISHSISATMSMNKYYGSLKEQESTKISDDALSLLAQNDFIGFIQACGPAYIRTINRLSDVIVLFVYRAGSTEKKRIISETIKRSASTDEEPKAESNNIFQDVETVISARGLSSDNRMVLSGNNLRINTRKEFIAALNFAYDAMLNPNSGVVKSVEIVSWTTNINFLHGIKMDVELQLARCVDNFNNEIDCNSDGVTSRTNVLTSTETKKILFLVNAEHITAVDRKLSEKMHAVQKLIQCIGRLHSLGASSCLVNSFETRNSVTVDQLLVQLTQGDENGESVVNRKIRELNDFLTYYYGPCLARLASEDASFPSGTLFTNHWLDTEECSDITCAMEGTVYDTVTGFCRFEERNETSTQFLIDSYCMPQVENVNYRCRAEKIYDGELLFPGEYICNGDYQFGLTERGRIVWANSNTNVVIQNIDIREFGSDSVLSFRDGSIDVYNDLYATQGAIGQNTGNCLSYTPGPEVIVAETRYQRMYGICVSDECMLEISSNGILSLTDGLGVNIEIFGSTLERNGYEYLLAQELKTHEQHRASAEAWGGYISWIEDTDELAFLQTEQLRVEAERVFVGVQYMTGNPPFYNWHGYTVQTSLSFFHTFCQDHLLNQQPGVIVTESSECLDGASSRERAFAWYKRSIL